MYESKSFTGIIVLTTYVLLTIIVYFDRKSINLRKLSDLNSILVESNLGNTSCKVAVVTIQNNEDDILDLWLRYYTALFTPKCVTILDNFSTCMETQRILTAWSNRGVNVVYKQGPYSAKGNLILKAFRSFYPESALALPIDIDEFLIPFNETVPVFNVTLLKDLLNQFIVNDSTTQLGLKPYFMCVMSTETDNISNLTYFSRNFYSDSMCKKIFKLAALKDLDHGNHHGTMMYGLTNFQTDLGYLHYHARGLHRSVQRAINDCKGFGYLPSNVTFQNLNESYDLIMAIRSKPNISGRHKVRQIASYLLGEKMVQPISSHHIKLPSLFDIINIIEQQVNLPSFIV